MNRRRCRQALDCGDGVCGVAALGLGKDARLGWAGRSVRWRRSQSGDFADSVTAVQDAGAHDLGSWSQFGDVTGPHSSLSGTSTFGSTYPAQIKTPTAQNSAP